MRALLLLLLLTLVAPAFAQDGLVSSAETDRRAYRYGETITFRYTITNTTDEPITFVIGCPNIPANIDYGPLPGIQQCAAAELPFTFAPNASRTWVWEIAPNVHGVPETTGRQTIRAYFGWNMELVPAEASFLARRYLGGQLDVFLADGVTLADVRDVGQALNARVVEENFYSYLVEISGTTLGDAIATYEDDPRFDALEPNYTIYPNGYPNGNSQPIPSDPILTADAATASASPVLEAAYPNPFATSTSFALTVSSDGRATVAVFDLLGREVATLHDGPLAAAEHHFTFHASALPAGVYVVRATGEGFAETRRVTLAR
ncbi:MAG: T9SS type A sorting domain-containing protein [Bacteroidota bacterium]